MSGLMSFDDAFRAADLAVRAVREEGLRDIERVVLEGSWYRQTYQKIASTAGYTEGYLSRDVGPALWETLSQALGVQVKKTNFKTAIERWSEQAQPSLGTNGATDNVVTVDNGHVIAPSALTIETDQAVTDALPFNVSDFRGRENDLATLVDWVISDRGRLLCLSGLPGSGKSWLAIKLAERIREQFQRFIYRDLRDRPTPSALIDTLLNTLGESLAGLESFSDRLDALIQALITSPSLIVLDGVESLYESQQLAGVYALEFAQYHELLVTLANREHHSCIMWVGRELPRTTSAIAGSSCCHYPLIGLTADEIAELAVWPDDIDATRDDWQILSHHYGGLPALILTKIAFRLTSFGNRLGACLEALHGEPHLVYSYLNEWLAPLSALEWRVLNWIFISQRPLSLAQLSDYLGLSAPLDALESLCDRGICRVMTQSDPAWELVLPELLSPYLCNRFLATFQAADDTAQFAWLSEYPLLQAEAPEMVRQWQRRTLLTAIAQHLANQYPQPADQQRFLETAFDQSQVAVPPAPAPDYRPGNLLNLAHHWQISLTQVNLQGLRLQGADLQSDVFQGVSFAGADLTQTLLAQPMGQCPMIAVNSQRSELAVGDQDGRLLLWDLQTGRLQRAMLAVTQAICAIAYSPDGQTLAEARQDGTVRLWELSSELGPERFAELSAGRLVNLAFSADKSLLAGGDEQGYLHIWRLASGEKVHQIPAHSAAVTAIVFSPCSQRLLSCGQDRVAAEWHLETGDSLHRFEGRLTALLGTVAYRPAVGAKLVQPIVVGQDDGQLVIWELESARPQFITSEPCEAFMAIAVSSDGRYLAASEVTNAVSVWEIQSRSRLCQLTEPQAPVEALIFQPHKAEIITGCDYSVKLWRLPAGQCLQVWRSDRHPARRLALSAEPLQLLSSHDDHTLRCWQFSLTRQRWLPQARVQIPEPAMTRVLTSSQPATYLAVGSETGKIHLWAQPAKQWLKWAIRLPKAVTALAFSRDGNLLAAGDAVGTVAMWDLPNRVFRWQKDQAHDDQVMTLAFSPDGQQIYSGSRDRTIRAWNLKGESTLTLAGHRRRVHTLCLSAAGDTLYSGSNDGTIQTWQVSNGECINTWEREDAAYIHQITLDGEQCPIALIGDTHTLALWDIPRRTCRMQFTTNGEALWHVSTSPDGQFLVCAGQNGEITLRAIATGEVQGKLRTDRPYEGVQIGGCLGLTDSEQQMLYSLGATDY